jgi:hypothetical protein
LRKFKNCVSFECKFNKISYILTKSHQNFYTKKWKKRQWKASICIKKKIASNEYLWNLFYYLMFVTFHPRAFCILTWTYGFSNMSKYWQGNNLGTWNDWMCVTFMPLTCAQGKLQYQCQLTKTREIWIMFNEKPNIIQISKIITHDIMIISQNFILLN